MERRIGRIIDSIWGPGQEEMDHHIIGTFRARYSEEGKRAITAQKAFEMTDRRNPHLPKWYTIDYHQARLDYFVETGVLETIPLTLKDGDIIQGYKFIPQPSQE